MKQSNANRKTNEQAREILANILLFEVSDPRLRLVTITGCEVSYDRSYCNVFYTSDPGTYEEAAAGFSAAVEDALAEIECVIKTELPDWFVQLIGLCTRM